MNRNIELKARLVSMEAALRAAREIGAVTQGTERQRDTYFIVPHGRLKLRERWKVQDPVLHASAQHPSDEPLPSQLIWYTRPDESRPRASDYTLVIISDGAGLRNLMTEAMGVSAMIQKLRRIFLFENVRIHLDDVSGLGKFLEFEAIVDAACDDVQALEKIERLRRIFDIAPDHILSGSYSNMCSPVLRLLGSTQVATSVPPSPSSLRRERRGIADER